MTKIEKREWSLHSEPEQARMRVRVALSTIERLKAYHRLLNDARDEAKRQPQESSRLSRYVAERAFETERHLRVFLKEAIDALNELRDSGRLESIISDSIRLVSRRKGMAILDEAAERIKQYIEKDYPGWNTAWLNEYLTLVKERVRDISIDEGRLRLSTIVGDEERDFIIEPTPQPGHLGRISAEDFFNALEAGGLVTSTLPVIVPDNCHHGQKGVSPPLEDQVVDIYGNLIGSLAYVREAFYRHARKTKEVGLGAFTGRSPADVVTIGFVVLAIGVVLVAVASAFNDPQLQEIGGFLMAVGVGVMLAGWIYGEITIAVSSSAL